MPKLRDKYQEHKQKYSYQNSSNHERYLHKKLHADNGRQVPIQYKTFKCHQDNYDTIMFDAHTHLNSDQLYPDRETHLDEFASAGGTGLINIWVNHTWNQRALHIAQQSHTVSTYATVWIHPWETLFGEVSSKEQATLDIEQLRTLHEANKDNVIGIGECGIDSHFERNKTIEVLQSYLFVAQCDLARDTWLPLVIHSRDNFWLTHEILQEYTDLSIYFHCRGYTPAEVQQAKKSFPQLWIWFCGNLTYPKAQLLRDSFQTAIDLEIPLVLETDAPYLSPQVVRGTQNAPKHIAHLYEYVTTHYDIRESTITHNITSLYRL